MISLVVRLAHRLPHVIVAAALVFAGSALADAPGFLPPDQAFRVRMTEAPGAVILHFAIADGYRLYGDRFQVTSDDPLAGSARSSADPAAWCRTRSRATPSRSSSTP
ncbi:protein-disulfide reductase DsbD domain-containing protein [Burkholderia glumae]|uniref:protein-disulfide reductase DsbD domain-containing protein n=1 Tax=Burkholderia glumae TaxID=337 RepID=UPI0021519253|nr:protein-disulfide reductase DsbD domain-containing protein [Burkholderia glumae]